MSLDPTRAAITTERLRSGMPWYLSHGPYSGPKALAALAREPSLRPRHQRECGHFDA